MLPMSVKPGDRVLLPGWGGNSIKVGDEVCFLTSYRGFLFRVLVLGDG